MSAVPRCDRAGGFSLLELAVVVCAIGILSGLALDRLLPLIGRAERVAFMQVQAELQTALILTTAEHLTRGESFLLPELVGTNPMSLLLVTPANYLGAIALPDHDAVPGRTWYYDEHAQQLVYRVGSQARFEALDGPANRVAFRVRFAYRDRDGDGAYQASRDLFDGIRLEPVSRYEWPD